MKIAIALTTLVAYVSAATLKKTTPCPPGFYPGFETNTFQITIPAEQFINVTGSFFNSEWYTGPLTATHGQDNTPGATRSGTFEGAPYTEQLLNYTAAPNALFFEFTHIGQPVTFAGITFVSYTEQFIVVGICGNTSSYVSFLVEDCTDNPVVAFNVYDQARRAAVDGVISGFQEAFVFKGTCPLVD